MILMSEFVVDIGAFLKPGSSISGLKHCIKYMLI